MTRKKKLIGGGILAVVGAVAATFAVVWYTLIPRDTPSRVTLTDAVAGLDAAQGGITADAGAATAADGLTGTWTIAPGSDSFVGYRVKEELARIGTTTAVGRTKNVTGSLSFDGRAITDARVQADLTTLESDNNLRDGQLRRQALETNTYPTASFALTRPIAVNGVPAEGQTMTATAVGNLTLHGVTREVSIDLQGQFVNGLVVVVGSLDITFADFGIAQPRAATVLSIEDHGALELQLVFQKAASAG